jgi:hypothetical protein
MTERITDIELSSGSGPTDAHQAMNALFVQVLVEAARRRQDELPGLTETLQDQVLFTSGGTARHALGWFAARAWQQHDRPVHELFINADFGTHDPWISPAEDVLVTLLHEACHVYAEVNGVKDTSRDGRYHNRRFAEIAIQIGLQVERHPQYGHHTTRLSARGRHDYADLLGELDRGLVLVRQPRPTEPTDVGADEASSAASVAAGAQPVVTKYVFAACQCRTDRGRVTIRVARGSWRTGVVRCSACGSVFAESLTTNAPASRTGSGLRTVGDAT